MTHLDGIDLSVANDSTLTHADDVDFDKVYAAGKRFVYLKATEAEHYVDPQFHAFVARASKTPLRLGAYPFIRVDENPKNDVDGFVRATDPVAQKLTLAPLFDLEARTAGMSARQTVDFCVGWMQEHVRLRGVGFVLYSYGAFLRSLVKELGGPKSPGALELVQFPLAIAQYSLTAPDLHGLPWDPHEGGIGWTIHQHSASDPRGPLGRCDGVNGYVDLDRFNGTLEDLDWLSSRAA